MVCQQLNIVLLLLQANRSEDRLVQEDLADQDARVRRCAGVWNLVFYAFNIGLLGVFLGPL